ncbi:MAG: hypothetical protein JKY45_05575 [Emcibacter sp.]|nr:hypothetical protein [Emcibacter sp.]
MKSRYRIVCGYFILTLLWFDQAAAVSLSGKLHLNKQAILISGEKKYNGKFDLRSILPMGDEFVLSKVIVSFKFQDDMEWIKKTGQHSLENTGKIIRHGGFSVRRNAVAGQTDHYYTAKSIIHLSNEEEVAKLTIGRNIYFGTTMRRKDVTRENLGQKNMMMGVYEDDGDNGRIRQHNRVTQSILETHLDGYDGLFEMRHKVLDLATAQDLAHSGVLNFELAGTGDYIFVEATLQYEGYAAEGQGKLEGTSLLGNVSWFILFGLTIGGLFWWKKKQPAPGKPERKIRTKNQKISRQRVARQSGF